MPHAGHRSCPLPGVWRLRQSPPGKENASGSHFSPAAGQLGCTGPARLLADTAARARSEDVLAMPPRRFRSSPPPPMLWYFCPSSKQWPGRL